IGEVFGAQTTVPLVHRSTPDTATQYSSPEGNMEQQGYGNPQGSVLWAARGNMEQQGLWVIHRVQSFGQHGVSPLNWMRGAGHRGLQSTQAAPGREGLSPFGSRATKSS
ncbi:unnamed protein product, partial [Staurois parvus]